jgi:hypothetical protein
MKSLLLALLVAGTFSLAAPVRGQNIYSAPVYDTEIAPRPMYRAYGPPLPYRVYRPTYRPYAHGGRQGVGYVWGFPWVVGGY